MHGQEFAISRVMYSELKIGMPLIILDKRQRKQAQAIISGFEPGTLAANGIQRYNIFFQDPRLVAYTGGETKLNRCGVAVRPFLLNPGASE